MKAAIFFIFHFSFFPFITHAQIITTIAGTGTPAYGGDGGQATAAQLQRPEGVAVDSIGNVYIADSWNRRVRKINPSGIISTIAGTGTSAIYSGDGGAATAATFIEIGGLYKDQYGNILLCNQGVNSHRINKIDTFGIITTIAGTGIFGFSGDGGSATAAQLNDVFDVTTDRYGNIYIADGANCRIRKVNSAGIITSIAGSSVTGGYAGDGGMATAALLGNPQGVVVDRNGNIFIADGANYCIRKVNTSGIITTIAGNGTLGYSGDGGPATTAQMQYTGSLDIDGLGNVYVADKFNHAIRKIDVSGIITTIAGTGIAGYTGDGGLPSVAQLRNPFYVVVHPNGDIYFTEQFNHIVRKISYGNHIPIVTGGHLQSISLCENATTALNTQLSVSDIDAGQTLTWTLITPPAHGTALAAYTTTATGGAVMPTGLSYTPVTGYSGNDTFEVRVDDGRSVAITTFYVMVNPLPIAAPIVGTDTICVGHATTFTGASAGGTWSSSSTGIATISGSGLCTAISPGTVIITYTVSNSCGTVAAADTVTIFSATDCPTGISNITPANTISILPNPNIGTFTLQLPNGENHVTITDITGRKVKEFTAYSTAIVNMNVAQGMYFVEVVTDGIRWKSKMVIKQ